MTEDSSIKSTLMLLTDEELVALSQTDIDNYRKKCTWECPLCGFTISYQDSLKKNNSIYIHEIRCNNFMGKKECKGKMVLKNSIGEKLDSIYFNELFFRYKSKMMKESRNYQNIDSFEEIYSSLISLFIKVVGMFAREEKWEKTGNKWFSSFFWRAVKNKIIDIRKMKNYNKRSPSVRCAICGKEIGQITAKHLMKNGHEKIFDRMIFEYGNTILYDSGENNYYSDNESLSKRAVFIGMTAFNKMNTKEKRDFYNSESLKVYYSLYPQSYFKNTILSTNQSIGDEDSGDIEDMDNDSVTEKCNTDYENIISKLNTRDTVNNIVSAMIKNRQNIKLLNNYFNEGIEEKIKIKIIKQVLFDKISYLHLKNVDSDDNYGEVKKGFTSMLLKIVKSNEECRKIIYDEIYSN